MRNRPIATNIGANTIVAVDGKIYIIAIGSPAAIVKQITEALLYPALDAFAPNAGS